MGLISETQTDLKEAFDDDLSDVVESFTLIQKEKGSYNSTTGTHTETLQYYEARGVFLEYDNKEIANEIEVGDVKLIVLVNEIYTAPEIDDVIERGSDDLNVINVTEVFGITYEVQLRGI